MISFEKVFSHVGHKIVIVKYGPAKGETDSVSIECEDCHEVIGSADRPECECVDESHYPSWSTKKATIR